MKLTRRMFISQAAMALTTPFILRNGWAAQAAGWPSKPITMVTPFDAGGSNDRFARVIAPALSQALGQPVIVLNKPGGNTLVGHTYFIQQPADGHTLLSTSASIYLASNILFQNAPFKIEDFSFINLPWTDTTMLVTAKNKPYDDLKAFLDDVKARPGQVSVGGITRSADQLNLMLMVKAMGLKPTDIRFVNYNGGGPLRSDAAAGHIDAMVAGAEGNMAVIDLIKPLVAYSEKPVKPWEAPSIVEASQLFTTPPEYTPGSIRGFGAHAEFRKSQPARWEKLVAAFKTASDDADTKVALQKQSIPTTWLGPEASDKLVQDSFRVLSAHKALLK